MLRPTAAALIALAVLAPIASAADEENPAKEALQKLNDFVGGWKGAASGRDENWAEKFSWGWKFKGDDAALVVEFKDGRDFAKGELRYDVEKKKYRLTVTDKKGDEKVFEGELKKGYLTLDHADPKTGETRRLVMNSAGGGVRFIYNLQRRPRGSTLFTKLYQVESTKEGESLAGGGKERECVVTGGRGTIAVAYQGKTYYVCCSGCRDAFTENPEKILKEYAERKKKD